MNVLIGGGVFYGETTAESGRAAGGRRPVGKRHSGCRACSFISCGVSDSGGGAAGECCRHSRAYCGVRLCRADGGASLREEEERVHLYSVFRARGGNDPCSVRRVSADERMEYRLRFADNVRNDGRYVRGVFHNNEQK